MARGTRLDALIGMLRAQVRESATQAVQQGWTEIFAAKLRDAQSALWMAHDWPHLTLKAPIPMVASTRLYDVPAGLNFEGIKRVDRLWQRDEWEVPYGIFPEHYSQYNSDLGIVAEPVLRWGIMSDSNAPYVDKIEVWPMPATTGSQALLISGKRVLPDLLVSADVAVLDDLLLVYVAAADILAGRGAKDAQAAHDRAGAYLKIVLGARQSPSRGKWNMLGSGTYRRPGRLIAPYTGT